MNFNVENVPFSRYGSYISFSKLHKNFKGSNGKEGLYFRILHGDAESKEVFLIELTKEQKPILYTIHASPSVLHLETSYGYVDICIAEEKVVRIKGKGVGIRLISKNEPYQENYAISLAQNRWMVNAFKNRTNFMITCLKGEVNVKSPFSDNESDCLIIDAWQDTQEYFELAIEEFRYNWNAREYNDSFEECAERVDKHFQVFLNRMPEVPERYSEARKLASYINWSCVVAPNGHFTRPAMLMSKNWMPSVWSWDNCFNAIALSYGYPELAWDQFMLMFDLQNEFGAIPDAVNNCIQVWNFCKPPVHGWALKKMMKNTEYIDFKKLEEVYTPLTKWTEFWFKYRDDDKDGIPQYNHGNDSGWDNSTVFSRKLPVESPDLTAFLILQMDVLSEIAQILGKIEESKQWKGRAEELYNKLMLHSLKGDKLVALVSGKHEQIESQSLLLNIPLILGKRLPQNVLSRLVQILKHDGMMTDYGLASEHPKSPFYRSNGYWRGPIWAPSTMLLVDALINIGEKDFAVDVCEKYAKMVSKSGFCENFDALTGEGLEDKAHTWSSSVFLILAHEYLYKKEL